MIKEINLDTVYAIRHHAMYPNDPSLVPVIGDENACHLGYIRDSVCVSTLSLFITDTSIQIRKFATLPHFQNQGYGSQLLSYALTHYKGPFFLNARKSKVSYYQKFGFIETGESFQKNDISYSIMTKELTTR